MREGEQTRLTETGRIEAFSDAVFAIAITLLVLDLRRPEVGHFGRALVQEWPTYLAYLVAFVTIASIWLSHHNTFSRISRADPVLLVLNLLLLLGASLVPWPTALIASALRGGDRHDEVAAIVVYAIVTVLISVPFTVMCSRLAHRPDLLETPQDQEWLRGHARASASPLAIAVVAIPIANWVPVLSLVLFLVMPLGFVVISMRATQTAPA